MRCTEIVVAGQSFFAEVIGGGVVRGSGSGGRFIRGRGSSRHFGQIDDRGRRRGGSIRRGSGSRARSRGGRGTLRSKTLGSSIAQPGRTGERTHPITPMAPAAFTLLVAIRRSTVMIGSRSSENLGESNESEEQVHGFECDESHCML